MDNLSLVEYESSFESKKISLPDELWKIVIEYLYDEDCEYGFGSILPYRAINKMFSCSVSESIKKVRFILETNLKQKKINNTIFGCNGLRSLHVSLFASSRVKQSIQSVTRVYPMIIQREICNNVVKGLHQIGNNCRNIEELTLKAEYIQHTSFPNLRRLTVRNIILLPPINMMDWTKLTCVEGGIWKDPFAHYISALPNLKEIKCESLAFHWQIIDFCNLCKEKSICNTLEVLDFSTDSKNNWPGNLYGRMNDDSLYLLLDTFPNLTAISIDHGDITLATANIAQKLSSLSQLRILRFKDTRILSNLTNGTNYDSINEWLLCFPKSLEIVSFLNCRILDTDDLHNHDLHLTLNSLKSSLVSRFYDILPNLSEIEITFKDDDPYHFLRAYRWSFIIE
jgi:hypothetical protein